jgi:hypothetical protein
MLWFFAWFVTYFSNLSSWFQSTANDIGSVPYVGSSLAYPFAVMASFFGNLTTASSYMGDWADTVFTSSYVIFNSIYNNLLNAFPVLSASGQWFFNQVQGYIAAGWWILTTSAYGLFSWIQSYISSGYWILTASAYTVFSWLQSQINSTYWILTASAQTIASWLWPALQALGAGAGITFDAIWNTITGGYIQAWITNWWTGQSNPVMAFITAQWGYLITSAFSFLNSNWASFESSFAWLAGKMIDLISRNAVSFASSIWDLLEKVLDKIEMG